MSAAIRLALLLSVCLLPAAGQAPAGFRTFRDPMGATFHAPSDYAQLPLEPTESVIRARFRRKTVPDELRAERVEQKPFIDVFMFRRNGGTTPGPDAAAAEVPGEPKNLREAMETAGQVGTFDDFQSRRLGAWKLSPVEGRERHFTLTPKAGGRMPATATGYLAFKEERGWVAGAYGVTLEAYLPKLRNIVVQLVQSLTLPEKDVSADPAGPNDADLDRLYPPGKYRAIESRKKVRRTLARGWKAIDTENFIVVHHTDSEKLINKVARDVEAMRGVYAELFPAVKEVDQVSIVRVCKDREEYLAYGGPPMAGGHWHPGNEELVFYDYYQTTLANSAKGVEARRTTDKDSFLVLYHEAFHQYIHYAVGEIAPHDWFNEGHGDFFSGAVIPQYGTKVLRIGPSPWRIHRAKDQFEKDRGRIPLERLLHATRAEYYRPGAAADYYAAGWSFVYFLRQAEVVKKHPRWSRLLDDYFETLKAASQEELARLGSAATLADRMRVQETARQRAIKAFLEDLELAPLEEAWKEFIIKLKDPWPHLRKS